MRKAFIITYYTPCIFLHFSNVANEIKKDIAPTSLINFINISVMFQKCFLQTEADIFTLLQFAETSQKLCNVTVDSFNVSMLCSCNEIFLCY